MDDNTTLPLILIVGLGAFMLTQSAGQPTGPNALASRYPSYASPSRSGNYSAFQRVPQGYMPQQGGLLNTLLGFGGTAAAGAAGKAAWNKASDFIGTAKSGSAGTAAGGAEVPMDYGFGAYAETPSTIAGGAASGPLAGAGQGAAEGAAADALIGNTAADAAMMDYGYGAATAGEAAAGEAAAAGEGVGMWEAVAAFFGF